MTKKEEFFNIVSKIKKEGLKEFLKWLEFETDFFEAPASSIYHCNYPGGLLEHSISVYNCLNELLKNNVNDEKIAFVSLFHDICKCKTYKKEIRNKKIENKWVQVYQYNIDEKFPVGHGEKSVILLQRFFDLDADEIYAIRWHMGAFDESVKGGFRKLLDVFKKCPLAMYLHFADTISSSQIEKTCKYVTLDGNIIF